MKKRREQPNEMARKAGKALRRAARTARKIALAYGTPIYIEKNGKIIALKPKVR